MTVILKTAVAFLLTVTFFGCVSIVKVAGAESDAETMIPTLSQTCSITVSSTTT